MQASSRLLTLRVEHKPLRYHAKIQQDLITTTRSRSRRSPGVGLHLVESLTCKRKQNPKTTRQIHCGTRFSFPHRKNKKESELSCTCHAACYVELLLVQLLLLVKGRRHDTNHVSFSSEKHHHHKGEFMTYEFTVNCSQTIDNAFACLLQLPKTSKPVTKTCSGFRK